MSLDLRGEVVGSSRGFTGSGTSFTAVKWRPQKESAEPLP